MKSKRFLRLFLTSTFLLLLISGLDFSLQAQSDDDEPSLHVGGAVRYNMLLTSYESDIDAQSSQFTWDTWRINAVYDNPSGIGLNFEYRFYPTFGTNFIKQGWLQYNFTDNIQGQLGVTQVPFGNLQYNSHNWWFSLPYYVGLEDDHDMGFKLTKSTENWQWDFAYFFQAEPEGPVGGTGNFGVGGSGRYSYDVIPEGNTPLTERNQFNIRGAYQLDNGEVGASLQYGQLYNSNQEDFSGQYAASVHADLNSGNFNIMPQILYYNMDATNEAGNDVSTAFMGAYGIPYQVSTEAWIGTLGIAYSYDVDWGPITNLNFYNDFSYMLNTVGEGETLLADGTTLDLDDNFESTIQNITGFLVTAGPVFTYFDIAQGVNQPWLTDNFGVGVGPGHGDLPQTDGNGDTISAEEAEYNIRFNINIGFYF